MPEKIAPYRSRGEKVISLFMHLWVYGDSHSLSDLANTLDCSKQTVLRLISDIRKSFGVDIEESSVGNRNYYRMKRMDRGTPLLSISEAELRVLQMCKSFTEHLLGKDLVDEATKALMKQEATLSGEKKLSPPRFASYCPGRIDYTPHQDSIRTIIDASENLKVCRVKYQAVMGKPKTFYVKPLKLFSYRDTLYLHAQKAKAPGEKYRTPDFDPLLAIHRIKKIEMTETPFELPKSYDFEKIFEREFGLMKDDSFEVEVEFKGWAAQYVSERIWSPDQEIKKVGKNRIRITFRSASEEEVISWILSFGADARVISPSWLLKTFTENTRGLFDIYNSGA